MASIAPSTRLRRSPFFDATGKAGVSSFTVYNHMLLPTGYGEREAEYDRLINGVAQWDVACQRQIRLKGRDAGRLAQILSPRDLSRCAVNQGKYVALCNHAGTVINDPILLKVADDCYWLSIADSNILFWARAIAAERGLDVFIDEPDISPLAIQGPKAEDVTASIFGDWVRELKYFRFREAEISGIPLMVARSGWSKQGGFELYLTDGSKGTALWDLVAEAGKPWDIGPGYPDPCERIESGLLSWGGDTDDDTNPFEIRMGGYTDLDVPDDVVGIQALREIERKGVKRHQLGVILQDDTPCETHSAWYDIVKDEQKIGDMTNGIWSFRLKRNIGFALVSRLCSANDEVTVVKNGEPIPAILTELPFV